jgi:hypothetical protein
MKCCLPLCAAVLATATNALAAPPPAGVAYIEAYDGPAAAFRIVHHGTTELPKPFLVLSAGDTVMVVQATDPNRRDLPNRITLYDGERTVDVVARTGEYCIGGADGVCGTQPSGGAGGAATISTIARNALQSAGRFLSGVEASHEADSAEMAATRSGDSVPIVVPLLETQGERLVAGQRALALEWKGGQPPFRVAVYRAGSAPPLATADAAGPAVRLSELALPAGSYRITIADNAGHRTDATFDAVPAGDLPVPTADESAVASDASLPAAMRTTLAAVQLVQRAPEFGFEAYQRVADLAATYQPADLVRYYLANPG